MCAQKSVLPLTDSFAVILRIISGLSCGEDVFGCHLPLVFVTSLSLFLHHCSHVKTAQLENFLVKMQHKWV